ncbi:MAG: Na+/H+ antiporter NhaA [Longimicrobiaceae bacterium]
MESNGPLATLRRWMAYEAAGGIALMAAAALALFCANTPLGPLYERLLALPVGVRAGTFVIDKPLLLWINDGLMAVFFFLIGMEVKREFLDGELSRPSQLVLPCVAALGGMLVPALFYVALNRADPVALNGWAIPAATDIAFALGILSLLGDRVPLPLKVLLTAFAILDDLAAIVIIAAFYTADLSPMALGLAAGALVVLFLLNRRGITRVAAYVLVGILLWIFVLKSGVHATLAGVALGLAIPLRTSDAEGHSPLRHLEHALHPWVAFLVLPVFAFANAGVSFKGVSAATLWQPLPLGIAGGLFVGKQVGVFGFCWLAIRAGLARLPTEAGWTHLYGVSLLAGIGFTMSLFIGSLAFPAGDPDYGTAVRLGVLAGSLLSGAVGYLVLRIATARQSVARVENGTARLA